MPLNNKGEEIKSAMQKQYGKERGEQVFYASKNKGTISGVDNMADPNYITGTGDVGGSSTTSGMTTGYNISTDADTDDEGTMVLDEDLTPERQKELQGDVPKSKASAPKDKSDLPDVKMPERTMTATLVPVTPLSIPVGDQSLGNMNNRNKSFWRR